VPFAKPRQKDYNKKEFKIFALQGYGMKKYKKDMLFLSFLLYFVTASIVYSSAEEGVAASSIDDLSDDTDIFTDLYLPKEAVLGKRKAPEALYTIDTLIQAVQQNNFDRINDCIESRVDLNGRNLDGKTPLMQAIDMQSLPLIRYLIKRHGVSVTFPALANKRYEKLPLIKAIDLGNHDIIRLLIKSCPDCIDFITYHGRTPLMYAICTGHISAAKILINNGAKVDAQDNYGVTSLMMCVDKKYIEILDLLIGKGANLNLQDYQGFTALMRAVQTSCADKIVNKILALPSLNLRLKTNVTVVHAWSDKYTHELLPDGHRLKQRLVDAYELQVKS